ncbi:MAG: orotate phosphoribosyltransferase [Myxococcota bacterium]
MSQPRDELLKLLTGLSFQRRRVVLSSGRESDFYVDCKQTLLHPEGMALTGTVLVDTWQEQGLEIDAVGGPTLGADPMTCAFVLQARRRGQGVPGFFIRKEPKGHGTMSWIEGTRSMEDGARVLVLEDVITTGASSIRAIQRLRDAACDVAGLFCLVDRMEGGREAIEAEGVPVTALYRRTDFPGMSEEPGEAS